MTEMREAYYAYTRGEYENSLRLFRECAEQGDARAMFRVGSQYANGVGAEKNYQIAAEWFHRAAEQGVDGAQWWLGKMADFGLGREVDHCEAFSWYRRCAEQNEAWYAQCSLGDCYAQGRGVDADTEKASQWYRKAAEQGRAEPQFKLARLLAEHPEMGRDHEVIKWWARAALQGHKDAAGWLRGDGWEWLNRQAERDDPEAQFALASALIEDGGLGSHSKQVVKWLRKAAEGGHVQAQAYLGSMYANGVGVGADAESAQQWFDRALVPEQESCAGT